MVGRIETELPLFRLVYVSRNVVGLLLLFLGKREREREGVQENNGTSYSNELQKNCRRLAGCVRRVVVIPPTVIFGFCDTK